MSGYRTAYPGSDGTRLSGIRWDGDPSLPLVLLVHGLASNARLWDGVAERLNRLGHTVLAVDQRGHGESDRVDEGYDFATLSADLATVLVEATTGPVIAAGQSWGGNVVLELAARHPRLVRGALLVDGGFIRLSDRFDDWAAAARALAPPDFTGLTAASLRAMGDSMFGHFPPAGRLGQLANFEQDEDGGVRPRLTRERHMCILRRLFEHDPYATASSVGLPVWVLAIQGGADRREPIERFVDALNNGRLIWADGHHDIHAEQPDRVADVLLDLAAETETG